MKSARHMLRRLAAASCAAAMCLLPMTGAKAATPYTGTSVSDIQYAKENSYIRYRQQYAAASRPDTIVEIEATSSYTASADAAVRTDTLDGRHALIWDSESGTVEWNFTVAEEGMYQFACDYYALPGKGGALEFELLLDGDYPFEEMQKIVLSRLWKDVNSPPLQDNQGNDIRSSMVEIFQWQTCSLVDTEGFINGAFCFYLTAGTHTLQLVSSKEPVAFSAFRFFNPKAVPSYEDYRAAQPEAPVIEGDVLRFEAELTSTKTSSMLYPFADRSDPLTSPSDPVKKRLNVIGGENWNTPDQVLTWEFTVPETGYYQLAFRYTQSYLRGFFVTREVAIDGAVPFTECGDVRFPYTVGNAVKVVGDDSPCLIYLEAGITHTLSMTPRIGALESLLSDVNYAVYQLNDAYRRIIMVTSNNPDLFRDYFLQEAIPGLMDTFTEAENVLRGAAAAIQKLTGFEGSEAASLLLVADQLASFLKQPNTIPSRLESFRTNVSSLAAWVLLIRDQSLTLDQFCLCPQGTDMPALKAGFWASLVFQLKAFFGSFTQDYESIGNTYAGGETITAWISSARDQAEVLKDLCDRIFTPETGIGVNLSLVQSGLLQAVLAGKAPDVALTVGRGDPINYALRDAVLPLENREGFEDLAAGYMPTALLPYTFDGHVYGLPETQNFHMMFYRTDIFEQLELAPPETWNDLLKVSETLQRNNMNIGLPYQSLDAYALVAQGMGGQTIFPTLLLQSGNGLYKDDFTGTTLSTASALSSFKMWTGFYTQYGFPVYKDDYNRFRTGEMPLVISYYTFYNQLLTAAPEIRGLWKMVAIPGTVTDTGIDRTAAASGNACILLSTCKNQEAAWKFLRWWTSTDTQTTYGQDIENVLGAAGRYNPANVEAMSRLSWSGKELAVLQAQWNNVQEIPEIPGGYYTSRNIDNAFKAVVYNNKNPREALNYWNRQIDAEILRKRKEFGLSQEGA